MSDKNKENSVVFSNKELKEVANTPPPKPIAPKRRASFIDDAGSILSDIKSAIGEEVAEELQRFEEERKSAAAAVLQREEALQEARKAEILARRAAEEARRQAAAEEREMLRHRLEHGPEVVSEPDGPKEVNFPPAEAQPFSEPAKQKSNMPVFASIAAVLMIAVGYFVVTSNSETTEPTPSTASVTETPKPPASPTASEVAADNSDGKLGAKSTVTDVGVATSEAATDAGLAKTDEKSAPDPEKKVKTTAQKRPKRKIAAKKKVKARPKKTAPEKKKKYEINLDDID